MTYRITHVIAPDTVPRYGVVSKCARCKRPVWDRDDVKDYEPKDVRCVECHAARMQEIYK